jgi:hypothetical protein
MAADAPESRQFRVHVQVELAEGWTEFWDVVDTVDALTEESLGDIGIHRFNAYDDFVDPLLDAVIAALRECEVLIPGGRYDLELDVMDGGTEIGWGSRHWREPPRDDSVAD